MKKIIFILTPLIILLAFFLSFENKPGRLKVVFMDAGQGDAILIKPPSGQNILIDGGPDDSVLYELPRYMKFWDRTIDLIILTHPHDDHVFGLIEVLKRYKVENVIYTGALNESPVYKAWEKILAQKDIAVIFLEGEKRIGLGEKCGLELIYPEKPLKNEKADANNSSIVSVLDCAGVRFLFTGDIEQEVESLLLLKKEKIAASVLKAAHHGSATSNTQGFLEAVDPEYAVISVGADNNYGHPGLRVLNRLKRMGINYYRTDLDGSVVFEAENGIIIKKE